MFSNFSFCLPLVSTNSHETMHLVVQHCVAARARISAVDALYCAKFVALLHTLTPEIWGISFYNKVGFCFCF